MWESGCFPPSWREAVVIPIPKPGKDHSAVCHCKTMERMINARLMWSLESQGLLSEKQCGFRKNRSTLDHLVRFETFIRNAFVKKEHVLTIFFDLEKAYDTTWKHGILADLWNLGFRGHLPRFIQSFLSEGLEWVPLFPSCTNRRWGSRKVAPWLRPFSALKLTTLLKLS